MKELGVPGNLLLLGEYAVLEEGGLGVAAAVERRVKVRVEGAPELRVTGLPGADPGRGSRDRSRNETRSEALIAAVAAAAERELGRAARLPSIHIDLDSSELFAPDGGKLGLGSSAAVALGLAQALLREAGLRDGQLKEASYRAALGAHRAWQGGAGSGYDIAASLQGGWILFRGGAVPSFASIELPWLPPFRLVRGPAPAATARAIEGYRSWKSREPFATARFLEASNDAVRAFVRSADWDEGSARLMEAARLGLGLGEALGFPAAIPDLEGRLGKALGAGSELGALWNDQAEGLPIEIAQEGLRWSA